MATHLSGRFNRPIGLMAGLSLLVSLFVAGPATSQTADPEPDYRATFDACPEDVIPASAFNDVSIRHPNVGDINCIAYYGITLGKTATTYAPDDPVIREHMALFLVRLARLVGIRVPPAINTPFQDISNLNPKSQEAISQIYQLGITIGATATTYAPSRNVSRGEMARFLQRLMDQMEPLKGRRDDYGYVPEEVAVNRSRFQVRSPFLDLDELRVGVFDAITHLYELGVASGLDGSDRFYRPTIDMSRAAMAEFMAGILDHSNLRPAGVTVQVAPTTGLDDFDITMMISVRDSTFNPIEDQPVDWFYTADDEGGLDKGKCLSDQILPDSADCTWDDDDDETDLDGNIFDRQINATSGNTMTFYAWIGQNSEEFDADVVTYSTAQALSVEGADSISVTWDDRDILPNAYRLDGAYLVDRDVDSLELIIQLLDENKREVSMEGVEIEVSVDSTRGGIEAVVASGEPSFEFVPAGDTDTDEETLETDRRGEAVFELEGPGRTDRLDQIRFFPDCQDCAHVDVDILWSGSDPVLMSAQPQFDSYKVGPSNNQVRFTVEYRLYDQYGETVSSTTGSRSGRDDTTVRGQLSYGLYGVEDVSNGRVTTIPNLDNASQQDMSFSRGRFTESVTETIVPDYRGYEGFFLVLMPVVFSDSNDNENEVLDLDEVRYVEGEKVVWFVTPSTGRGDLPDSCTLTDGPAGVDLPALEVYPEEDQFRTCFTLWSYDTDEDLFRVGGNTVGIDEFEEALGTSSLSDLTISLYSTSRDGISVFSLS